MAKMQVINRKVDLREYLPTPVCSAVCNAEGFKAIEKIAELTEVRDDG